MNDLTATLAALRLRAQEELSGTLAESQFVDVLGKKSRNYRTR